MRVDEPRARTSLIPAAAEQPAVGKAIAHQALVEHYADSRVKNFSEAQHGLLANARELSAFFTSTLPGTGIPPALAALVEGHRAAFAALVAERPDVTSAEAVIRAHRRFEGPIAALLAGDKEGSFIGKGSNGSAYRLELDGKTYAVKIAASLTQTNFERKALQLAVGLPHVAQLVSFDLTRGVTVMELLPGQDVTKRDPTVPPPYTDAHIRQLIDTVIAMDARGLVIDPKASNFLFDHEAGFSVLDFHRKSPSSRASSSVMWLCAFNSALTAADYPRVAYGSPEAEAQQRQCYDVFVPMMARFVGILERHYPELVDDLKAHRAREAADPSKYLGALLDPATVPEHLLEVARGLPAWVTENPSRRELR